MGKQDQNSAWRVTPLTVLLALVAMALLGWSFVLVRKTDSANASQQAEIEQMVKLTNEFHGKTHNIRDETRALLDPLAMLLELDRRLEKGGLPPLSGKEFADRLAAEDRRLVASGSTEYIDTCRQKSEVEKHLLYQGLHGPIKALPGWSEDWQTACISILPIPEH